VKFVLTRRAHIRFGAAFLQFKCQLCQILFILVEMLQNCNHIPTFVRIIGTQKIIRKPPALFCISQYYHDSSYFCQRLTRPGIAAKSWDIVVRTFPFKTILSAFKSYAADSAVTSAPLPQIRTGLLQKMKRFSCW